jgi:hypothetical protein
MTDTIVIQPQINTLAITEDVNDVVISSVGVQGAKGDTGATGATGAKGDTGDTGAQGPSGVVTVNAPLTNAGTSSAANLSISAGTTSAAGALQLTDSVSSTSTTTAATPNAVKTAYDSSLLKGTNTEHISGRYYRTIANVPAVATTYSVNVTRYTPIFIPRTTTYDRIAVRTGNVFSGTASVRLGIFNNLNGKPNTVLLDAGTVSATAGGTIYQITIDETLEAGFYWLAFNSITAATTNAFFAFDSNATAVSYMNSYSDLSINNPALGFTASENASSSFATASSPSVSTNIPGLALRAE